MKELRDGTIMTQLEQLGASFGSDPEAVTYIAGGKSGGNDIDFVSSHLSIG